MSYSKRLGLGYQGPSYVLLVIAVRHAYIFSLLLTRIRLMMLFFDLELRRFVFVDGFLIFFVLWLSYTVVLSVRFRTRLIVECESLGKKIKRIISFLSRS